MVSDWVLKTIAQCASSDPYSTQIGPFGKALMAHEYTQSGVPVLRGVNVNRGRFHDDDYVFISEDKADQLSKFESYPDDVLLVHKGTLGEIGLMPSKRKYTRYILGNSMMRVRCDPSKLLPEYLFYWLSSPEGKSYLFSRVSQVGVPQLQTPLTTLREAVLPVPPIPEQRAIVRVLSALDEKIELEQQIGRTLEAIGQTVYNHWFIDFEFPDKGSNPYKTSGGNMVDSELGIMPSQWQIGELSQIADLTMGVSPKGTSYNETGDGMPLLNGAADFQRSAILPRKWTTEPIRVCRKGNLLFCIRATIGNLVFADKEYCLGRGVAALNPRNVIFTEFIYYILKQSLAELTSKASGSVILGLSKNDIEALPVMIPDTATLSKFHETCSSLFRRIASRDNATVTSIRDNLLPRLISGKMRVPIGSEGGEGK